jgi:hypothetical protein
MIRVLATREGLTGQKTATGYVIEEHVPFVALPAQRALYRAVRCRNPANGRSCIALVLDVGPWNTSDDAYVFHGARPAAEAGISLSGRGTNKAGIDLGEKVWRDLAMQDNAPVEWEFIDHTEP